MLRALITPLMMVIPQLAENGPLLSKAWTWHLYHPESAPGMMGREPLSTEKWMPQEVLLRIEEAKVNEAGGYSLGAAGATALPRRLQGYRQPHPSVCLLCLSLLGHPTGLLGVLYPPGLRLQRYVFPVVVQPVGGCKLSLCTGLLHLLPGVPGLFTFPLRLFFRCPSTFSADLWDSCSDWQMCSGSGCSEPSGLLSMAGRIVFSQVLCLCF